MNIKRKDTILLAVLLNTALLAILLLATARFVEEPLPLQTPSPHQLGSSPEEGGQKGYEPLQVVRAQQNPADEVDRMIHQYVLENSEREKKAPLPPSKTSSHAEVAVKRGDTLEKIASTSGTSVSALKKLNGLSSDRLQIGQLLLIPEEPESSSQKPLKKPAKDRLRLYGDEVETLEGAVFYRVQSGDNPWIIARKFGLKYREILELNGLDEQTARNLKVGDRIRIQ